MRKSTFWGSQNASKIEQKCCPNRGSKKTCFWTYFFLTIINFENAEAWFCRHGRCFVSFWANCVFEFQRHFNMNMHRKQPQKTCPNHEQKHTKNLVFIEPRFCCIFDWFCKDLGPKNNTKITFLGTQCCEALIVWGVQEAMIFQKGALEGLAIDFGGPRGRLGGI